MSAQPRPAGPAPMTATRLPVGLTARHVGAPALLERLVGDVLLDGADGHRAEAVIQRAGAFAQAVLRADAAADLGQRVGLVRELGGLEQLALVDQLQPVRDVVVHRALPLAERIAAVEAAARLVARRPAARTGHRSRRNSCTRTSTGSFSGSRRGTSRNCRSCRRSSCRRACSGSRSGNRGRAALRLHQPELRRGSVRKSSQDLRAPRRCRSRRTGALDQAPAGAGSALPCPPAWMRWMSISSWL